MFTKLPPYLQPGDLAIAIATSGALKTTDALQQGLEVWKSQGYRVELGNHWDSKNGYLAGTDIQRIRPRCDRVSDLLSNYR